MEDKNSVVEKHLQSFNELYALSEEQILDRARMDFPLDQVEMIHWGRGQEYNTYYSYFYRRFTCHILEHLDVRPGHSVLNVGCGRDSCSKNLKHLYQDLSLWSTDISQVMLVQAQRMGSPARLCMSQAEKLPFPDASFDRVLARESIEHVMNQSAMLKEISRVLKPGGIAVVSTENPESLNPRNRFEESHGTVKDHAPTCEMMYLMAGLAGLVLDKHFFDGALYLFLPFSKETPASEAASLAHYFSRLENNARFAKMFCDQAKYVLRKPASQNVQENLAGYVCKKCRKPLQNIEESSLHCSECGASYAKKQGIPDFIEHDQDGVVEEELHCVNATSDSASEDKVFNVFFEQISKSYEGWFLSAALKASKLCKGNTDKKSRLISSEFFLNYMKSY